MARDAIKWPMTETMIKDLTKDSLYERLFRSQYGGGHQWPTPLTRRQAMKDPNAVAQFKVGDRVVLVKDDPYSSRKAGEVGTVQRVTASPGITYNFWDEVMWDNGALVSTYEDFLGPVTGTAKSFAMGDRVTLPTGAVGTVVDVTKGGAVRVDGEYYDPAKLAPAPKDAFTGPLPKTAGEMLDAIDQFLSAGDDKAADLAAVLTALRGPDGGGSDEKSHTTVPIRIAALPKTAQCVNQWIRVGTWGGMNFTRTSAYGVPASTTSHFYAHALEAVNALKRMGREVK